jgi:hypothetical protein
VTEKQQKVAEIDEVALAGKLKGTCRVHTFEHPFAVVATPPGLD